jgi:hypothetical protein
MQARRFRHAAIVAPMALILTFATGATIPDSETARGLSQTSGAHRPMSRLALANAHVKYMYLDEVVAGRHGAMTPEVYQARALLEYLLLPEVMLYFSFEADVH